MQIWRSLPGYDLQARLGTWSYRVALNTAISWKRRKARGKRRAPETRLPPDHLQSRAGESNELRLLERFLQTLSEIDRAVLLMYLDDLTSTEIAASIGVSNGAIRTRLSRIRDQLRDWERDDDES